MRFPKRLGLAALCATGVMVLASHANAALVDVTYTGVATGYDHNIFGSVQSYVNTPFVAHYSFDEVAAYPGQPGGDIGSFLGADFTINGVTFSVVGPAVTSSAAGGADGNSPGYGRTNSVRLYEHDFSGGEFDSRFIMISNAVTSDLVPEERTDAFSSSVSNAGNLWSGWNTFQVQTHFVYAFFRFTNQSITVTSVEGTPTTGHGVVAAVVPEPGAWAMMLLGFASIGAALRAARQRKPRLSQ